MEPIYHFLIPVLLLLLLVKNKKLVFLLAPIAIIPDFDVFIPNLHRTLFHNIFFGIVLMAVAYFIIKKFYKTKLSSFILIASVLFFSHLLLDFDASGVAFFFPFDQYAYAVTSSGLSKIPLSEFYLSLEDLISLDLFLYLQIFAIIILQIFFINHVFPLKKIYYRIKRS